LTQLGDSARSEPWLRAVLYGFLAELTTVLTIISVVVLYRYVFATGASAGVYAAFGVRTGETVGIVGGTIYTFLFARLLMPRVRREFVTTGVIVALSAVAFSIGGSLLGHRGVPAGYLLASALKVAAGALAGVLLRRRSVSPAIP
jgi:hypothetical protein